jgi:small conductance mechanosensitive channel
MILQIRERLEAASRPVVDTARSDWRRAIGQLFRVEDLVAALLHVAFVILVAFLAYRVLKLISRRMVRKEIAEEDPLVKRQRKQRIETMAGLMNNVGAVVIVTLALLTALNYLNVPILSLVSFVSVATLAISFGAQSLVKDVIAGAFILMEGQYGIGDVVKLGDSTGLVERITLRTTTLRDVYGTVHTIPNGQIATVSNLTKSWSRAVVDVTVAYKVDVDSVMALLRRIGAELAADESWGQLLLGDPEVPGVENLADSGVVIRMMIKTLPLKQWEVARELRRRIKQRFEAERIEIPFPTVTFYWGDGQLPPALGAPGALVAAPARPDGGS